MVMCYCLGIIVERLNAIIYFLMSGKYQVNLCTSSNHLFMNMPNVKLLFEYFFMALVFKFLSLQM